MASNISTTFSADTAPLKAGVEDASAAVRSFASEATRASAGINGATVAAQQATTAFSGMSQGAQDMARNLLTAGAAATQGGFAQIPQVTSAAQEGLSAVAGVASSLPGPLGVAAAAGMAVASALSYLTLRALESRNALQGVFSAALMQGRNADFARVQVESAAAGIAKAADMSSAESIKIASAIGVLPGVTEVTRAALLRLAPALHEALRSTTGGDAAKTAEEIAKIFQSSQSVTKFVRENALVAANDMGTFNAALGDTTGAKMQELAIAGLERRIGQSFTDMKKLGEDYKKWINDILTNQKLGQVGQLPDMSFEAFQKARGLNGAALNQLSPVELPVTEAMRDYLQVAGQMQTSEQELNKLQSNRAIVAKALAETEDAASRTTMAAQLRELDQLIALNSAKGDTSWEQAQRAALERERNAVLDRVTDAKKARSEVLRAEIDFWTKAGQQSGLTQGQITAAETNAAAARRQLRMQELQDMAAAAKTGAADAKRAEAERIAGLMQESRTRAQITGEAIAQRKAELDEDVNAQRISKAQALAILAKFVQDQRTIELQALADTLAQIPEGTRAAQQVADQKLLIEQRLQRELQQLRAQETREIQMAAQRQTQAYLQSFSSVEGSFKSAISGLVMGTTTWAKATQGIMQSIAGGFVDLGMKMLGDWVATQIAMTMTEAEQEQVRNAIRMGKSGLGALASHILGEWLGIETAKTGISAAAETVRSGEKVAAEAATTAIGAATRVAEVEGLAAVAGAAAFASTAAIPIIGPELAPGAAAAAYAATMGFAPLAAAAQGVWDLPKDMPMQLHKGEMVVPQRFAAGMRQNAGSVLGSGNGQQSVVLNINATDAASFLGQMKNIKRDVARMVRDVWRHDPTLRPAY